MNKYLIKFFWMGFPLFNNLINLIFTKIIANISSIGRFGEFNLVKSVIMFIGPIITLGLPQALIRFLPSDKDRKEIFLKKLLKHQKILFLILSIFSSIIYIY